MNKENLTKLANFLESEISDKQFNIDHFRSNEEGRGTEFINKNNCGTIGCAVGWSPFVIDVVESDYDIFDKTLSFGKYCNRTLINTLTDRWVYMFSDEWAKTEFDSRLDCVKRIRNVVNGLSESDAFYRFEDKIL